MGAAVVGALLGPVVGTAAVLLGRGAVFAGLAGLALVLACATLSVEAPIVAPSRTALAGALRERRIRAGLATLMIAAMLGGLLSVLAPLRLAAAGWGTVAIGAMWLISAALEALESPLVGRISDRHGALRPISLALMAGTVVSLALATRATPAIYAPLVVLAALSYGALYTPSFALISEGAERSGLAQGIAFGLMNGAWATGAMAGPALGGAIAGAVGDTIPFLLAGLLCLAAVGAIRSPVGMRRTPSPLKENADAAL